MKTEQLSLRPVRRYRNLKECLRKNIWGAKKDAGVIALDSQIDPSVLSRWMSDNPDDNSGKWVNKFVPLLIAMEENGEEVLAYIQEEVKAAREAKEKKVQEDATAKADLFIAQYGPMLMDALKVKIEALEAGKK
jgi:hypothetical protein